MGFLETVSLCACLHIGGKIAYIWTSPHLAKVALTWELLLLFITTLHNIHLYSSITISLTHVSDSACVSSSALPSPAIACSTSFTFISSPSLPHSGAPLLFTHHTRVSLPPTYKCPYSSFPLNIILTSMPPSIAIIIFLSYFKLYHNLST